MNPSSLEIVRFSDVSQDPNTLTAIREIFFISSARQNFSGEIEKENFFQRWTKFYVTQMPEQVWLATRNKQILGYLTGCLDSLSAKSELERNLPGYEVFEDLFATYPAHLHINLRSESRGQGIGEKLVQCFVKDLREHQVPGLHIVTSPQARNVTFYEKLGLVDRFQRPWRQNKLLFMGGRIPHK